MVLVEPPIKIEDFKAISSVRDMGIKETAEKMGYNRESIANSITEYINSKQYLISKLNELFNFGEEEEEDDDKDEVEDKDESEAVKKKEESLRLQAVRQKSLDLERLYWIDQLEISSIDVVEAECDVTSSTLKEAVKWYLKLIKSLEKMVVEERQVQQPERVVEELVEPDEEQQPEKQQEENRNRNKNKNKNNNNEEEQQ